MNREIETDEVQLRRFGYAQELARQLGGFQNFNSLRASTQHGNADSASRFNIARDADR